MKREKTRTICTSTYLCMLFFLCKCFGNVSAQSHDSLKKWHFLTDVYPMLPYMDGEMGIGNVITIPVDANPGDIFSKLKFAGMLYIEARYVSVDYFFLSMVT